MIYKKLNPTAEKMIFAGYSQEHKVYSLLHKAKRKAYRVEIRGLSEANQDSPPKTFRRRIDRVPIDTQANRRTRLSIEESTDSDDETSVEIDEP